MLNPLLWTGAALIAAAIYFVAPSDALGFAFGVLSILAGISFALRGLGRLGAIGAGVLLACGLGLSRAAAADAMAAPDAVSLIGQVLQAVLALGISGALYLAHRAVKSFAGLVHNATVNLHLPIIDDAIAAAVAYVNKAIDQAGADATLATRSTAIDQALRLTLAHCGPSLDATGTTVGALKARLALALGAPAAALAPAPVAAAAPETQVGDVIEALKSLLNAAKVVPGAAPAPAVADPVAATTGGIATALGGVACLGLIMLTGCSGVITAAEQAAPIASDLACWSQAASNATGAALEAAGDAEGAAKASELSKITGAACALIDALPLPAAGITTTAAK